MQEILTDSIIDCLKLLPFLYLSYLAVEYAEHRMSEKTKIMIYRAGKAGPVIGALIGVIPQCGFAAAAAGLFAGGMLSPGTLLAVFLSTSDEMLPIMLSEGIAFSVILKILLVKVIVAMAAGLALDLVAEKVLGRRNELPDHPHMCEHDHCGCGEHGIWQSAFAHTVQTAGFLFLISLAIGAAMELFDVAGFSHTIAGMHGVTELVAGLVGMIPNCAASVLITQLFLEGILGSGALFSGLLCGAGTGLLVLYRENSSRRMNLAITAALYISGTVSGMIIGMLGIL
ncbi:MAG: putative manganese transporter [Lachnospiraceae bacterium]|uniref:putative manganese transporter n=1 Tax=Parablautia sp. Marseille-Q6255 TaxID=3039593 RepID=UPI0024BC946E|nr:putative manganese transporter [Parablautia sp. Marseille-Q6255]